MLPAVYGIAPHFPALEASLMLFIELTRACRLEVTVMSILDGHVWGVALSLLACVARASRYLPD